MKSSLKKALIMLVVLSLTLACGLSNTGKEIVTENTALYDKGVTMVRDYQVTAADYFLVINSCAAKMDRAEKTVESYAAAVNANTEAWTGNFREQQAQLEAQLEMYKAAIDPATGKIDPSKLDLAALAQSGSLPSGLTGGLNLYFNAVTQAPPPEVKVELYQSLLDIQSECYDSIVYMGSKVNDKAGLYNTWRSQVTGEIVAKVSATVGFPIPDSLPLVTGNNGVGTDQIP